MQARRWMWAWVAVSAAAPAAASEPAPAAVLVTPVQGSPAVSAGRRERVVDAVGRALESQGCTVDVSQALLGQAVVACQSPECIEQALDAANAELAIVPALWSQESVGEELTLTLLERVGRNLNASGPVGGDPSATAEALVNELLAKRAAQAPVSAASPAPAPATVTKHPNSWKTGPIILLAGGTAAFVAIGVGAAARGNDEQLNTAAVAAWSLVGAAAIAGGIAWWAVGANRRKQAPTITLHPTGVDLRLRF